MEEVEDTPIFQERVSYLEGQSKTIKAEAKLLLAQAHSFAKAGIEYAEAGKAFRATRASQSCLRHLRQATR